MRRVPACTGSSPSKGSAWRRPRASTRSTRGWWPSSATSSRPPARRIRRKNLDAAAFVAFQSVRATMLASLLERPPGLGQEELVEEIADLVLRYLVDVPAARGARPSLRGRVLRAAQAEHRDAVAPRVVHAVGRAQAVRVVVVRAAADRVLALGRGWG